MGGNTYTYEHNSGIDYIVGLSLTALTAYLTTFGVPAYVSGPLGVIIYNLIADNTPYKLVASYSTYEVQTLDGGYYTHCYHYTSVVFDSAGHVVGSSSGTVDRIGG